VKGKAPSLLSNDCKAYYVWHFFKSAFLLTPNSQAAFSALNLFLLPSLSLIPNQAKPDAVRKVFGADSIAIDADSVTAAD
jgi:hypothetical protein